MKKLLVLITSGFMVMTAMANDPDKVTAIPPSVDNMEEVLDNLVYPIEARQEAIEGNVTISFIIDEEGNIVRSKITNACDPKLKEAMQEVIKDFKFTPAMKDGKPAAGKVTVPFKFTLEVE